MILVAFVVARIFYNNQLGLKDLRTHFVERLQSPKLILVYGPTRSYEPWGPINSHETKNYKFVDWDGTPCEETRCQITFDKKLLPFSDAVLVHRNWMQIKRIEEELLRIKRPLEQRWVFYTKESPGMMPLTPLVNGFFNWTATYRRDADFFVPYGYYAPLKEQNEQLTAGDIQDSSQTINLQSMEDEVNHANGKDKLALHGASTHCVGQRFELIRALMKYIDISFFGKCADQFESNNTFVCPFNLENGCDEEIKRHKFYLAFENSLCIDYVTEKYWRNSLERGLVPVVYGASRYSPEDVIPGSFINVADFGSIKALADYLKYLDKNDTAYNQYFKWETKYKVVKHTFWLCQLCKALHDPTKPTKIYHNISYYWGVKGACQINKDHYYKLIDNA